MVTRIGIVWYLDVEIQVRLWCGVTSFHFTGAAITATRLVDMKKIALKFALSSHAKETAYVSGISRARANLPLSQQLLNAR